MKGEIEMAHILKIFTSGAQNKERIALEVEVYPSPESDGNNMYKFERTDGKQILTNMNFIVEEKSEDDS